MKNPVRIVLLAATLLAASSPPAGAEARRQNHASVSGREYVQLGGWARANEFAISWLEREKTLLLTNRRARLVFTVDSAEAQINGIRLWLSFPILFRNGAVWISQLDLEESLAPLLEPPTNPPGIKIKTICLDPGHGGSDPGYRLGRKQEQEYTLLLAQEARRQLESAGFKVVLTRRTDKYVELSSRPALANLRKADLFVSLHFNSTETSRNEVKGVETYCLTPAGAFSTNARGEGDTRWVAGNRHSEKSLLLAYQVQTALVKTLSVEDRGVRRARFQVLREAQMPAILIEGGFMSHPVEGKRIFDPAYRRQMARAIVDGIHAYKSIVKG